MKTLFEENETLTQIVNDAANPPARVSPIYNFSSINTAKTADIIYMYKIYLLI